VSVKNVLPKRKMIDEQGYYGEVDLHRLTEFPDSLQEFKKKTFNVDYLEREVQRKIEAITPRDNDRFRTILKIWRTYATSHNPEDALASVNKENFRQILELLGVFATPEQADELFDRFDIDGDGNLTVHEFVTKSRPKDFANAKNIFKVDPAGKRTFLERKYTGVYKRPVTPDHYGFNLTFLKDGIRKKIHTHKPITYTNSVPKARRDLALIFERIDDDRNRYIDEKGLRLAFGKLNFPMHDSHFQQLMNHFMAAPKYNETYPLFDYPKFVLFVYPAGEGQVKDGSLSLFLDTEREGLRNAYAQQHWIQDDLMKDKDLRFLEQRINTAREYQSDIYGIPYKPVTRYLTLEEQELKDAQEMAEIYRKKNTKANTARPSTVSGPITLPPTTKPTLPPTNKPIVPVTSIKSARTVNSIIKRNPKFRLPRAQTKRRGWR